MNTPFHNTVIVSNFQPFVQVFSLCFPIFLFVIAPGYQHITILKMRYKQHPTEHRYNI